MAVALDAPTKERLRAVLDEQPVTEAELRKLAEDGQACIRIMRAELARHENALAELSSDPTSSLAEMAVALREVNELRPELEELTSLLDDLQDRARDFRRAWVAAH